jgi:hypothetical protein
LGLYAKPAAVVPNSRIIDRNFAGVAGKLPTRQTFLRALIVQQRDTKLPHLIDASGPTSRFTRSLDRRQQQADKNADDRNYYQ